MAARARVSPVPWATLQILAGPEIALHPPAGALLHKIRTAPTTKAGRSRAKIRAPARMRSLFSHTRLFAKIGEGPRFCQFLAGIAAFRVAAAWLDNQRD